MNTAALKKEYKERIAPSLQKQFNYTSSMQIPVLKKIVINQGLGDATQDKKIIEIAINEITAIFLLLIPLSTPSFNVVIAWSIFSSIDIRTSFFRVNFIKKDKISDMIAYIC